MNGWGILAMFVGGSLLTWWSSLALESSAGRLCRRFGVPPLIEGTLVLAAASSFPELTATIASAAFHDAGELGIATIVGSAVFNILVIPGVAGLASGRLEYDLTLVYRDGLFYVATVVVLLLVFCFAVLYVPTEAPLTGLLTRPLALIPLGVYGLYLFLQQQDFAAARASTKEGSEEDAKEPLEGGAAMDFARFGTSLVGVVLGVEALLRTALWLGDTLDTPSVLWGGSVIAAVTSAPDLVVSVRAARRGNGQVAVGNVLGSNVFDLLVAVPAGALVAGAIVVEMAVVTPLMAALVLSTLALLVMMRRGIAISRTESIVLLGLYAAFLLWLVLEAFGVTQLLG